MYRNTYSEINLANLKFNVKKLKALAAGAFFCPMVKANAYGHGAVQVSKAIETVGVDGLGVALLEEAVELRDAGVKVPILHFGPFKASHVLVFFDKEITPVVTSAEELNYLIELGRPLKIHLKVDTEMNRLGFKEAGLEHALGLIKKSQLSLEGICTHFAEGETLSDSESSTSKSLFNFLGIIKTYNLEDCKIHCLNGEGLLSFKNQEQFKLGARPGLSIYGVGHIAEAHQLKPVMSFFSEVIQVKEVMVGETVSYSKTWKAEVDTNIAVVSVGYADGYPWLLSNKAFVSITGFEFKMIGRVCMDYVMIDLGSVNEADKTSSLSVQVGDKVLLWGQSKNDEISLQVLADLAGSIPYELLTGVSSRVPRKYTNDSN